MPEITATLKYGKGFEDAWIVVKGESAGEVREQIGEATGLDVEGITLSDAVLNAARHVHKMNKHAETFGGTVIETKTSRRTAEPEKDSDAPEAPQKAAEETSGNDLLQQIEALEDKKALGRLFLRNREAFEADSSLMDALKKRTQAVGN